MDDSFVDRYWRDLLSALQTLDTRRDITDGEKKMYQDAARIVNEQKSHRGFSLVETDILHRTTTGRYDIDVRVMYVAGQDVYTEVKCHWPSFWLEQGHKSGKSANSSLGTYKKHLFCLKRGGRRRNYSTALDLDKLANHIPANATHVSTLLVGSYSKAPHPFAYASLPADFDELEQIMHLNGAPWCRRTLPDWPNPHCPGFLRDVRLFVCDRKDIPDWWQRVERLYS